MSARRPIVRAFAQISADQADDAGAAKPGHDLVDAEFPELGCNEGRGIFHREKKLGLV